MTAKAGLLPIKKFNISNDNDTRVLVEVVVVVIMTLEDCQGWLADHREIQY